MSITCDEATDMLAGFAMTRLDREDEAAVTEHLSGCRLHDTELAELKALAGALPLDAEEVAPPDRLRRNLMRAFETEMTPAKAQRQDRSNAGTGILGWLARRPQLGYALAAGLAVAVIGLAAWNLALSSNS
ncbi:MAG TPA: hypothetical protein VH951_13045, partial [Dehalococcoidia bacterium]